MRNRTAVVVGKGNKTRTVKFDAKCALALDRYLRKRGEHRASKDFDALWFGVRRRMPMTPSGIPRVIERRGERLGLDIHPHLFRHTFSHNWLDEGVLRGPDGVERLVFAADAPPLWGSAKAARARRAYDRIDVMRGV